MTEKAKGDSNCWDVYWSGVEGTGAFSDGGVSHPSISGFWTAFFDAQNKDFSETPRQIVDVASGDGAVLDVASRVLTSGETKLIATDLSGSAINRLKSAHPNIECIVCDAAEVPLPSESADIVTSQFGIEYASHAAISEAARLVKDEGILALLLHDRSGQIYLQSKANLEATEKLIDAQVIPLAKNMFNFAFQAASGGDRDNYELAAQEFSGGIKSMENIMRTYGAEIAGGMIYKLYNDLADIHESIMNYQQEELNIWLDRFATELNAYQQRMSSMLAAAKNEAEVKTIVDSLKRANFAITIADKLFPPDSKTPLAWLVVATKQKQQ